VAATGEQARVVSGESAEAAFRRVIAERPRQDLPLISAALDADVDLQSGEWQMLLRHLLAGIAAARGEDLPALHRSTASRETPLR
jgi:hypothetical protein